MTKPITSVALLMLYEEGKFQLTDPLSKYFPAIADMKVFAGTTRDGALLLDAPKRPITIKVAREIKPPTMKYPESVERREVLVASW